MVLHRAEHQNECRSAADEKGVVCTQKIKWERSGFCCWKSLKKYCCICRLQKVNLISWLIPPPKVLCKSSITIKVIWAYPCGPRYPFPSLLVPRKGCTLLSLTQLLKIVSIDFYNYMFWYRETPTIKKGPPKIKNLQDRVLSKKDK